MTCCSRSLAALLSHSSENNGNQSTAAVMWGRSCVEGSPSARRSGIPRILGEGRSVLEKDYHNVSSRRVLALSRHTRSNIARLYVINICFFQVILVFVQACGLLGRFPTSPCATKTVLQGLEDGSWTSDVESFRINYEV